MVDTPGDNTTTRTITVGGTVNDTLETLGDHDWFAITLTAGQSITVFVDGLSLEDSYVRIYDQNGVLIAENDDISLGVNRDSRVSFTASISGTYYIDVGAFDDAYTGTYQVSVTTYTPPPVGTIEDMANQLVSGYWGGDSHHFNVSQGGSITVNLTALTPAGQTLARAALALWKDIIGVNFVEVSSGGQIVFDDNQDGAFSDGIWSNGIISSATVNISVDWLATYGTSLTSYSFQTYIHEIGHALGLGHAGNYNGDAQYPFDATYLNDGWPITVMSYFSQTENTYYVNQGFDRNFTATPMMADILAMSKLYGLSTTTRNGDTTYGPSWTNSMGAICLFDSGGIDTIDVSSLAGSQTINLNPGTFSNVLGEVGNVSIALGVIIENAKAGNGNDTLIGNNADNILIGGGGNDVLNGGAGNDTLSGNAGIDILTGGLGSDLFKDTASGLNGDTITDLTVGDKIVITNATLAGFTFSLSGSTLTYTGGSLTLTGFSGTLTASAAAGGGVELSVSSVAARNDFNGDGRSDILWRNDNGTLSDWLGSANGGFVTNDGNAVSFAPVNWHVAGIGDFNGDGRSDILWRNDTGTLSNWLGTSNGGFVANDANAVAFVSTDWQIAGVGDFNGDGRSDILWRNDNGVLSDWLGTANGGFAANDANAVTYAPLDWHVVGIGDFNGDGRSDILWRNDAGLLSNWLGTATGGFSNNDVHALAGVPTDWHVIGVGDFNGDGRDDILWRNDDGTLIDWLGNADGSFTPNANAYAQVPLDWLVAAIGDFNGDGRDDILWRNNNGIVSDWLGNANGGFTPNDANAVSFAPTDWHVQAPDIHYL